VVHRQVPFGHEFLDIAQAEREPQVPTHASHDHSGLELSLPEQRWTAGSHPVTLPDPSCNTSNQSANDGPVQPKMIAPSVLPRIEQSDQIPRRRHRGYVRTFVSIADHARIRKVISSCVAAMLSANDVIDLVRKRTVILMNDAIFTSQHRPLHYFGA
jgi:hypothetical protein